MLKRIPINFDWKYSPDFKEDYLAPDFNDSLFERIQIPHSNIEIPFNNFDETIYQFESCYRKNLTIASLEKGQRVYISFEGVMTYARVYLNGIEAGEHKGGYTAFRVDLTDLVQPGADNILAVYVDSREREDIPPFGHVVDYLTFGGIYRDVSLEYVSSVYCEYINVKTWDLLSGQPRLETELYIKNFTGRDEALDCRFILRKDGEDDRVFNESLVLKGKRDEKITLSEPVGGVKLWDIENPELYEWTVFLYREDLCIDSRSVRLGFRDIHFDKTGFYLNGKKIKIRGLNRHQSFPYVGYAMPASAQYRDAEILKNELGVNAVRLSHYPQSRHFLDRCDELGLLVFDEIPGWQHIGGEEWKKVSLENVREMILTDMNHPSVIIWGVRINESQDSDEFYGKTNDLARSLDDSRPTGGVRCIMNSHLLEDVYAYNDFVHNGRNQGLEKKKKVTKTDKAYLITEHTGHMFPTKKFDNESHRVDQAKRHLTVLNAMEGDDQVAGAFGWSMIDYNTHKDFGSGDKICYHGVMDMFRIPKHAAFAYRSQGESEPFMHMAGSFNIGENEGSLMENIHILTNCDYVKFYKGEQFVGDFYPRSDLYPNLSHPPVIIDDHVGNAIAEDEIFSRGDAAIVKKLLAEVSRKGANLNLLQTLQMGWIFLKYRMNTRHAEDLYTKYYGGWGGSALDYRFEGFRDGDCVCRMVKNQNFTPRLSVQADSPILVERDTWDTSRVVLTVVDEKDNSLIYGHDAVSLESEGPIEIIGPRIIPLAGGSAGFWVKSAGESGQGIITVSSDRFGIRELIFDIKKEKIEG